MRECIKYFYNSILNAITYQTKFLKNPNIKYALNSMSDISIKKEFKTFKLSLPRRMGKTTIAIKLLKKFKNSIYIGHNKDIVKDLKRIFNINDRIYSIIDIRSNNKNNFDLIIIDESSYIPKNKIEEIYALESKFYILIG